MLLEVLESTTYQNAQQQMLYFIIFINVQQYCFVLTVLFSTHYSTII